ncbi:hypothetical protein [Kribbella voronezhensis]|uniref:hypothetical protein n=1 Tax=Kribbella voronezhensis TaxID=2512212 RepID=UPI001063BE61|nr:hypothetical protein [Kribbella voronezhensis]
MKGTIAVGCGLVLLAGWQSSPAVAAETAVSGVDLAWTDTTHTKIRITWTETTPVANSLRLDPGDGSEPLPLGSVPASAPNELLVDTSHLGSTSSSAISKIVVTDPSGGEASSPGFDRFVPGVSDPELTVMADGRVRWSVPAATGQDTTPRDPLDLDEPARYTLTLRLNELPHTVMNCGEVTLPSTTEPTGIIANRNKPYDLFVDTANEWAPNGLHGGLGGYGHVSTTALTLSAPGSSAYGVPISLTGTLSGRYIYETGRPPACAETSSAIGSGELVTLQGRNSGTSPWYVIGSTHTVAGGKYTFTLPNPGARDYRTVVANQSGSATATYGSTSASKLVRATTRVMSAKFITPTITYGTRPQAYLWVNPAGTQRAALQFKTATGAWQGVAYKTLYAGKGLLQFPWNRRGTTQFRWYIPASTHNGLPVDPIYTGAFSLTVR